MMRHSPNNGTLCLHNDGDELYHYILYYWKYIYPSPSVCNAKVAITINLFQAMGIMYTFLERTMFRDVIACLL